MIIRQSRWLNVRLWCSQQNRMLFSVPSAVWPLLLFFFFVLFILWYFKQLVLHLRWSQPLSSAFAWSKPTRNTPTPGALIQIRSETISQLVLSRCPCIVSPSSSVKDVYSIPSSYRLWFYWEMRDSFSDSDCGHLYCIPNQFPIASRISKYIFIKFHPSNDHWMWTSISSVAIVCSPLVTNLLM